MTYFRLRSSKWAIKVNTTDASIVYSCSDMCKSWILSWVGVYTLQITGMNLAWQGLTLLWKHRSLTGSRYMSTFESNFCPQAPCPLFHQVFSIDASKWFGPLVLVRSRCRVALRAHKWRSCDWATREGVEEGTQEAKLEYEVVEERICCFHILEWHYVSHGA